MLHAGSVGLVIQKEHNVPKEGLLEFEGLVTEILPDARYRVQLDNGHQLVAYTAGRMRKNRIKTLAGDRMTVEVSPYDLEKGRLIFRHKDERAGSLSRPPQRHHFRRRSRVAVKSAIVHAMKAMHLDRAHQWRQLAHQVERDLVRPPLR